MSAEAKITIRDADGRSVEVHLIGHQDEHANYLLEAAAKAASTQMTQLGINPFDRKQ